ncbi:Protein of unknown function [Cotesia congregata]|uniref:Uncharacterized protein n=1 Tax=Cotesia congregata TaxID=51543 RepID=A0A8J2MMH2_COTCN|nr:Protein of unknown function [Cotesia congregata]
MYIIFQTCKYGGEGSNSVSEFCILTLTSSFTSKYTEKSGVDRMYYRTLKTFILGFILTSFLLITQIQVMLGLLNQRMTLLVAMPPYGVYPGFCGFRRTFKLCISWKREFHPYLDALSRVKPCLVVLCTAVRRNVQD